MHTINFADGGDPSGDCVGGTGADSIAHRFVIINRMTFYMLINHSKQSLRRCWLPYGILNPRDFSTYQSHNYGILN